MKRFISMIVMAICFSLVLKDLPECKESLGEAIMLLISSYAYGYYDAKEFSN